MLIEAGLTARVERSRFAELTERADTARHFDISIWQPSQE